MADVMTDYSLGQDFNSKFQLIGKLNKELIVISQLIESLKSSKIKSDKDKKKEFSDRKKLKLDELQRLGRDVGCITALGGMTDICSAGLIVIADFFLIYTQQCSGGSSDRSNFITLYDQIMLLMESKEDVKQLRGENQILGFLNNIGLSESDYKPALEKWLDAFFESDSLIDKTAAGSVYIMNRIYDRFFYLGNTNFNVSLTNIRGEIEKIMNRDMSVLLTEDYQWFGFYIFVFYKVLDRFLRPLSQFKDIDEFMSAVHLKNAENANEINIMDTLKAFAGQVTTLQEESNNILQDIPHKVSYANGLKFLQEVSKDSEAFIESLSDFVLDSAWIKRQLSFLSVSEQNIISLLDMIRQKVLLKEKSSLVSRDDFMSTEWCKLYLSYYYNAIEESINSPYAFEGTVDETRDLQVFLDYLSCDKLHKVISVTLSRLFLAMQQIADLKNSLSCFKVHLLVEKIPYLEEQFLNFLGEKEKELAMIDDKNKLFEDSFLFFNQINDTIPLLCFLSVEKINVIHKLQEKWKNNCDVLEKERINDKQASSKNPNPEMGVLPFSEPIQKPILLAEYLPGLKSRLQELGANTLIALACIEERVHDYKKTNKNNKLIDRFKSASGQVYAAVWYLKKFLNIESEITMTALLTKIIERVETEDEKDQSGLDIDLLKNDIARCSESVQLMLDKVKELKDKLIKLQQEKEVLMLGRTDEKFSFSTIKKMAKIVESYKKLKDQFWFLYDFMRILSVNDQLQRENLELTSFYELHDDLNVFEKTYRTLDNHRHLLCHIAYSAEIVTEKVLESAIKQDEPVAEEKQQKNPEENTLEIELLHETSVCHDVKQLLNEGFEDWRNQVGIEVAQVTSAIMNASDELLERLYPLFVRILQHYQQKIEAKQSECLEKLLCVEKVQLYCEQTYFEISRWLNYMDCRLYYFSNACTAGSATAEGNNRQYLFFQTNYGAKDSVDKVNMADYLVAAMNMNDIEKQIAAEEKKLFNHSQSFIKPLCQNDSVYADGFEGLDKRIFEASEQMFKVSQLKIRLGFEKEKKQIVFEQLAKKMDEQSLKSFIKRVDSRVSVEFAATSMITYLSAVTSAFYLLPIALVPVVDSDYSSHAYQFMSTPP
ncbi:hypothetical protein [Rickettsiella endosymbiont of Dermanyssus gallinae]|uniref:hypothetical protein n=1 Tax=Rickettsiella endosymbiont of Dermanyssus gallinae TaxID=2856608 RepID=UPI001C52B41E|nr:hypothetical protein [Rickettsiella endosymbiont of Dermanyssus gallinae]